MITGFRLTALVAAIGVICMTGLAAQTPPQAGPPTVAQANARLAAQDAAGAVKILEAVTTREPGNVMAWRTIGVALMQTKEYDRAIDALQKALALQPNTGNVLDNIGAVYAFEGQHDQAFAWLEQAKAARADMTRADLDPNFASIRKDARFSRVMPTDRDFADSFVEPVTVIREWRGESPNDQFGWIARNIGDVDDDGVADIVTSAPSGSRGGASAGRIYVYSTRLGGLLWTMDGQAGDQLGLGIEAAGDTNADGIPDVIASASGRGEAYVLSGRDGRRLLTLKGASPAEQFGRHVSGLGDVNGDGHADVSVDAYGATVAGDAFGKAGWLIVGAPGAGPNNRGRGYVYQRLERTPKFIVEADATGAALGEGPGEGLGTSPSAVGDVDGDGHADILVGAWQYAGGAVSGVRTFTPARTGHSSGPIRTRRRATRSASMRWAWATSMATAPWTSSSRRPGRPSGATDRDGCS